jgi:hypothetical protein
MYIKGQVVGPFRLDRKIGEGGIGEVWKARPTEGNNEAVALKIANEPLFIENLKADGAVDPGLDHPSIVKLHRIEIDSNPPYLVMDLVEGKSLRQVLDEEKHLEWEESVILMIQILRALAFGHERGVSHGNIKPENILITSDWTAKIGDYNLGPAQEKTIAIVLEGRRKSLWTEKIRAIGPYRAPELAKGESHAPASDIYALGILLYEMLTGKRPKGRFYKLPSERDRRCPKILNELISRCLERRPGDRFQDAGAMERELLDGLERTGIKVHFDREPARWIEKGPRPAGEGFRPGVFLANALFAAIVTTAAVCAMILPLIGPNLSYSRFLRSPNFYLVACPAFLILYLVLVLAGYTRTGLFRHLYELLCSAAFTFLVAIIVLIPVIALSIAPTERIADLWPSILLVFFGVTLILKANHIVGFWKWERNGFAWMEGRLFSREMEGM